MYQIVIDLCQLQFKNSPSTYNLQIAVKVLSSTKPPLPSSSANQEIPYRVIFYDSQKNTFNDAETMRLVFRKLQEQYGELMRSNFSDAGFQESRDMREGGNRGEINRQPRNQDRRDDNRGNRDQIQENKHTTIQNNAPNLNNNSQPQPPSVFTKNTTTPQPFIPSSISSSKSPNPFVSSSSSSTKNSHSLFGNQPQNYQNSNSGTNMNIFGRNSNYAYGNGSGNSQRSHGFNNNSASGGAPNNMYNRQSNNTNNAGHTGSEGLGLFIDHSKGSSSRYGASKGKKPNLA